MPPTVKSDLDNASVEKNKCSQYACNSLQAETPQPIACFFPQSAMPGYLTASGFILRSCLPGSGRAFLF